MTEKTQNVNITVAGGYQPAVVKLQKDVPATLTFTRTNAQGCLDVVHSKSLHFEKNLPLNESQTVTVATDKAGEYEFSCGMDMFKGKVVIE